MYAMDISYKISKAYAFDKLHYENTYFRLEA